MSEHVSGLHHVTAISGSAAGNYRFHTSLLGLRFVKKTVNFDDPGTYHLYYGNATGEPGTVMTFFPWEQLPPGRSGTGEVGLTHYAVPAGSGGFWSARLAAAGTAVERQDELFGERRILARDPDGLRFALVEVQDDNRAPWTAEGIPEDAAIRGFHGMTLNLAAAGPTVELLTGLLGYAEIAKAGSVTRLKAKSGVGAGIVDIVSAPASPPARQGAGSVHHVAFRVPDRDAQQAVRQSLTDNGFGATPQIDRNYFYSIYFRSPGGILFEIATDEPGFTVDEPADTLGEALKLPSQHEHLRAYLEATLVPLEQV